MRNAPELIVMLTYNDLTVMNAAEIFEECKNSKAKYWGLKEQPLPREEIKKLYSRMKECGKTTFLEVVSYTEEEGLEGARIAAECGCDILMGTTYFESIHNFCQEHNLKYMPFVGKIEGRPSVLGGEISDMVAEAKSYLDKGVYGIDLLGYRYTGDCTKLYQAFKENIDAPVCIAGSICSYERLSEIKEIAPWAFTIGSAFFDHKFGDSIAEQIDAVCDFMNPQTEATSSKQTTSSSGNPSRGKNSTKKRVLFCEICPMTYAISLQKEILKRHLKNLIKRERYAVERSEEKMPVLVASHGGDMIKRGPGIDMQLQINKADNIRLACSRMNNLIIHPGESFSFWHYVGKTSQRNGFTEGRVIINGKLVSGVGGGLCNLANTLNLLIMDSPMTVTEIHHHSDALAPDPDGIRVPYSAGTSVNYNFIDYRFRNDTDQPVQLSTWCEGDLLHTELRTTKEFPFSYRIVEDDHHFHQEDNGKFYRKSKIYREIINKSTGEVVKRELKWNNRSEVMFDYSLIPVDQIR